MAAGRIRSGQGLADSTGLEVKNGPAGKILSSDIHLIDRVSAMEGGYVLNSSNQSFAEFFLGRVWRKHR